MYCQSIVKYCKVSWARSVTMIERRSSWAFVDPQSMSGIEGTFSFTGTTKTADPLSILVVAMDLEGAITIGEQKNRRHPEMRSWLA